MPSFQDSAFIFFLALLLFGPRKLPELARQVGKLMGEFRRASNEFRMQMEDELRMAEQADKQKEIAAIEAAAPVQPALQAENTIASPDQEPSVGPASAPIEDPLNDHPHMRSEPMAEIPATEPLPISRSGDLDLMPPATGLPIGRSAISSDLGPALSSIPSVEPPSQPAPPDRYTGSPEHPAEPALSPEAHTHG